MKKILLLLIPIFLFSCAKEVKKNTDNKPITKIEDTVIVQKET